jgi:uncharacterized protein
MSASQTETGRVSRLGEYSGFSTAEYDGWIRSSQYVGVRDGTRLAVDIFRPTRDGEVEETALPVVWTAKRYLRATVDLDGKLTTLVDTSGPMERPAARRLLTHGYVLAAADMRGTGASFGTWHECSDPAASTDGYDINEWLAAQTWCDGNVGMFGVSYEGRMQLNVASSAPPHLKAIMPEVSPFDWYSIIHEGGIYGKSFIGIETMFRACDIDQRKVEGAQDGDGATDVGQWLSQRVVAPVDDDVNGHNRDEARREHEANDYSATSGLLPLRDSVGPRGNQPWLDNDGVHLVRGIEASGVATYQTSGWFARVGIDQLLWFSNLARGATGDRHRILMGPWPAGGEANANPAARELWSTETLRFMDYWLKGIDNGIMSEPPVVYSTQVSSRDRTADRWHYASHWPLPEARPTQFLFEGGPSGSVSSLNDGLLARGDSSGSPSGRDEFSVDYAIAAPNGEQDPGVDYRGYDERCLTYTTVPLDDDLEVTGHPVVNLFVSSTAADGDFVVTLLDVDEEGTSTLVTDKRFRASHRSVAEPPFYYFDAPWHRDTEADLAPIPEGEVVELVFDLLPTSYRFRTDHRIRITVAGADQAYLTPILDPVPRVAIHRDATHPSRITLPIVPTARRGSNLPSA